MNQTYLKPIYSGKVRDLYEVDHDSMLMVASDRISVFDVVLPDVVPDKGRILTGLSAWWFEQTAGIVPNHLISADPTDLPDMAGDVDGRAMLVRVTKPVRMECVVRGHLFGSAWAEYETNGTIGGWPAPPGLRQAERLEHPMFTPTTKADAGHDLAITSEEAIGLVGGETFERLRDLSIHLYEFGADHAASRGLVLADTKFEFGHRDGELLLIDEMLTPDSSRYWPADGWEPGQVPPSFDKQYVRDFMAATGWNKEPPAPPVPADVIANTRAKYVEAYEMLTGSSFDDWYAPE